MKGSRRFGLIGGLLLVAAWTVGCAAGSSNGSGLGAPESGSPAGPAGDNIGGYSNNATTLPGIALPGGTLPAIGPKVVKVADVDIGVQHGDFDAGLQQVTEVAGRYQGFVVSTNVISPGGSTVPPLPETGSGPANPPYPQKEPGVPSTGVAQTGSESRSGTVVIRVPASNFEAALARITRLGRVTGESVSGQDVSSSFIDLHARLRNASAQKAVLLRLMDRAKSTSSTIRIERQLKGAQLEIEQLKGQLRYLHGATAMGTITVGMTQLAAAPQQEGSIPKAWHQASATFVAMISTLIVGASYLVPIGLVALIALAVVRRVRPHTV